MRTMRWYGVLALWLLAAAVVFAAPTTDQWKQAWQNFIAYPAVHPALKQATPVLPANPGPGETVVPLVDKAGTKIGSLQLFDEYIRMVRLDPPTSPVPATITAEKAKEIAVAFAHTALAPIAAPEEVKPPVVWNTPKSYLPFNITYTYESVTVRSLQIRVDGQGMITEIFLKPELSWEHKLDFRQVITPCPTMEVVEKRLRSCLVSQKITGEIDIRRLVRNVTFSNDRPIIEWLGSFFVKNDDTTQIGYVHFAEEDARILTPLSLVPWPPRPSPPRP